MAGRKGKKGRRGKRGKKGARRGSTAKRGAALKTLRAGIVVSTKPRKDVLKKRCLIAKSVGKDPRGKKLWKLTSSASCKTRKGLSTKFKQIEAAAKKELISEGIAKPTRKQIREKAKPVKDLARQLAKKDKPGKAAAPKRTMTPEQWEAAQKGMGKFTGVGEKVTVASLGLPSAPVVVPL